MTESNKTFMTNRSEGQYFKQLDLQRASITLPFPTTTIFSGTCICEPCEQTTRTGVKILASQSIKFYLAP